MYTASIVLSVVVWIPVLLFSRPVSAAAVHPVDCPFASTARKTIPSALPTKLATGVKVTPVSVTS